MKLPLHFGFASLLVLSSAIAAEAQGYYRYPYNTAYPYTMQGYYPAYTSNPYHYNYNYNYNANYPTNTYGGATVNADGSFSNNGVSWNGADPTGGATGLRRGARVSTGGATGLLHGNNGTAAYENPGAGGASALHPHVGYGYGTNYGYGTPLRQPVYHIYRPRAFSYHND